MAGVWMSWAGTLEDLGVSILIIALGRWLASVVNWSAAALPAPKVILPTPITIIIATFSVIIAPIIAAVVTTPINVSVVGVAILLVGARSSANIFLDLLVGLVSVCPLLRHREQVLD
jgi:hypothetical protein